MDNSKTAIAIFPNHTAAELAVKELGKAGFAMKTLSVVGKGYHSEEKVIGFYDFGDRVNFWGSRGAFWGGLWGLLFGGIFIVTPVAGPVIVLGVLASMAISTLEGAVVVGGLSALGAALYGVGVPKNTVVEYESMIKADEFLVMAHGTAEEMARAKAILSGSGPTRLDMFEAVKKAEDAEHAAHVAA